MKKLAAAIAAIALIGTPAFAQAPPPAPVYNWTGWYVGGNVGASFGTFKTDFNVAPVSVFTAVPQPPEPPLLRTITTPGSAGRDELYPGGFIGGGQIGYNWQYSPLIVVGLEADFQGADEKEHSTLTGNFTAMTMTGAPVLTATGTTVFDYAAKIDWFGTVRGRIGYVWGNGEVLTYFTGGLAYGRVGLDGTSTVSGSVSGPFPTPTPFSVAQAFGHNAVNTGWVVGSGTEGKLLIPGWTYKIEALYMDLGTLDTTGVTTGVSPINPTGGLVVGVTGGQVTTHTRFTDTILRVGLNYQFH